MPLPRFITLEGGEGVGKSTQSARLTDALRRRGLHVVETREPGGSDGAEAIRALLLGGAASRWNARAEALLFAAARSDHVERIIRPALARGQWVVCDRFIDSSLAYQGAASGMGLADLRALHAFGSEGLYPHRTLLLLADPDECARRCESRDGGPRDRFAARDAGFHLRVENGFRALANAEPDRFRLIDASAPEQDVAVRVSRAVEDLL
ncbi:MAG TPA: dTMP kinase [Sphingomonadaceae bacterium]|nr:dTMP kinase [Sphingomonadaceae bacterium]